MTFMISHGGLVKLVMSVPLPTVGAVITQPTAAFIFIMPLRLVLVLLPTLLCKAGNDKFRTPTGVVQAVERLY